MLRASQIRTTQQRQETMLDINKSFFLLTLEFFSIQKKGKRRKGTYGTESILDKQ